MSTKTRTRNPEKNGAASGPHVAASPASPPEPPPNWHTSYFPQDEFLAAHVRCNLLIGSDGHTAALNISADAHPFVQVDLDVTQCKSLHDRLREAAADCRVVHAFTDVQPRPAFFFNPVNPAPASNEQVWHHSRLRSLDVHVAYRLRVVTLSGVATNGESFWTRLTVEISEALAHDLARTIARLEGRTPWLP